MSFLRKLFKNIKASQLVEKILIAAFSVSAGGAVIVYGATVIKENSSGVVDEDDISGRTFGYNNIFNFAASSWVNDNVDVYNMTKTSDKLSFECYADDGRFNKGIITHINAVLGHKYLFSYCVLSSVSFNLDSSGNTANPTTVINMAPTSIPKNSLTNVQMIVEAEGSGLTWRMGRGFTTVQIGDKIEFTNAFIVDLTEWYGAGQEPTTAGEFKSKFPNDYYPYQVNPIQLTKGEINRL